MEQLIKMGVRAEQQALARWGLNYVIDEYLPRKLKATDEVSAIGTLSFLTTYHLLFRQSSWIPL